MIAATVEELTPLIGTRSACRALGASPATIYRRRRPPEPKPPKPRPTPARALSTPERQQVLDVLHCERFVDVSPEETWATLLDEGSYLCSPRTMYRILAAHHGGVRDRRNQLTHPAYAKPELLAERPNELWSWDVSKLKGPAKWTYFYLYVILDVFSRYVVGWTVQHRETAQLAKALIEQATERQQISPKILTLHADRGADALQAGRVPARGSRGWFTLHLLGQSLISRSNGAAGTLILRPFRWPLVTWMACSSPRWTLCNTVWRAHPSWRAASASGT